MAWNFTIDARAVGLVKDLILDKVIGTTFSFVKPNWYVTAKHVIFDYGQIRERLVVLIDKEPPIHAQVLFVHPELDLAVLELERAVCEKPLFPSHHAFAGTTGLLAAGYAPSKKHPNGSSCEACFYFGCVPPRSDTVLEVKRFLPNSDQTAF
jgi:hypothetical protein